ncbi:hypothetical protein HQO83_17765 [Rhodococcus fascians]|nr:hypothetical protein [Rhodococcus fascians]
MTDINQHRCYNADGDTNLIPLDKAALFVLPMISRFADGLTEPMVIERMAGRAAVWIST